MYKHEALYNYVKFPWILNSSECIIINSETCHLSPKYNFQLN